MAYPLQVIFYKTSKGNEPVREWLKEPCLSACCTRLHPHHLLRLPGCPHVPLYRPA